MVLRPTQTGWFAHLVSMQTVSPGLPVEPKHKQKTISAWSSNIMKERCLSDVPHCVLHRAHWLYSDNNGRA